MKYSTVFKGISWLFLSTISSQIISLLTLPYISRAYDESSLSIMGIMASALVLLTILSTLRLEFYIIKKTEEENIEYVSALYLMALVSSILFTPFLIYYITQKNIEIDALSMIFIIVYLATSFSLNISTLNLTSEKKFSLLALIKTTRTLTLLLSLWILNGYGPLSIFASLGISTTVPLLIYAYQNKSKHDKVLRNISEKLLTIKNQLITTYHAAVQAILNVVNLQFISFYVVIFGSQNLIASYFFMERIINAPLNLIASSLRQVLYKDFVDHSKCTTSLLKRYTLYQLLLLFGAMCLYVLFKIYGQLTIDVILGDNWSLVHKLADIYVLVVIFQIINIPTTPLFLTIDKMKTLANLEKIDLGIKLTISTYAYAENLEFITLLSILTTYICLYYIVASSTLYALLINKRKYD